MLLIYLDEHSLSRDEREHCYQESTQLARDLAARGNFIATAPLQPTATAKSIRIRDGKPLVTEGPFAETREQLGGYFLINAKDEDEALRIAARIPGARAGTVEVRPVIEIPGLPGDPAAPISAGAHEQARTDSASAAGHWKRYPGFSSQR
jgi:hypothetical protein